ncbi:MAG: DnaA regulatory inactivator Hda [Solimonas sp.]
MKGRQLTLAVQLRDTASFASYWAGGNADVVAALRELRDPVLLYGPPQSGRTHLLQAACREHRGAYLPLREIAGYGPEALDGFDGSALLALDDVDAVASAGSADGRAWALALARLIDRRRAGGRRFIASAAAPPDRLPLALPDLRTRLAACVVLGLQALGDAERATLLKERAQARGLTLSDDVVRWLLHTQTRTTGALLDALDALDRASLREKRRLTLPFAQSVLGAAAAS